MNKNDKYFSDNRFKKNIKEKALVGASSIIIANIFNYGIQAIGTIFLARLLLPEDFGMVTMVAVFSMLLLNFGKNGFTEAIIQQKSITHNQISTLFWINLGSCILLTGILLIFSPLIIKFYGEPRIKPIIYALSLTILFGSFSTIHLAIL